MLLKDYVVCGLLIGAIGSPVAQRELSPGGIERLQATPASSIEAGLPDTRFDRWFAGLVQPAKPEYERNNCGEASATAAVCATVTAVLGPSRIALSFVVGTYSVNKGIASPMEKPAKVSFLSGSIGPANPQMKFPTRAIRKLSDVEKLLRP